MTRRLLLATVCALLAWPVAGLAGNGVSVSVIRTGQAAPTPEAVVVEGGRWTTLRRLSMNAVLIRHPLGALLFDTGFGAHVDEHVAGNSWLDRVLLRYSNVDPVVAQLKRNGVEPSSLRAVIPSHLHWDHIDALEELIGVPVWVRPGAVEAAKLGKRPAYIAEQFDSPDIRWLDLPFEDRPLLGFPRSFDVYGDRSVQLIELAGHTHGDVGMLLTLDSGRRLLFIGDISWTMRGVETNRPRPAIIDKLAPVDVDRKALIATLQIIHDVHERDPSILIVPAHDEFVTAELPQFPTFAD